MANVYPGMVEETDRALWSETEQETFDRLARNDFLEEFLEDTLPIAKKILTSRQQDYLFMFLNGLSFAEIALSAGVSRAAVCYMFHGRVTKTRRGNRVYPGIFVRLRKAIKEDPTLMEKYEKF